MGRKKETDEVKVKRVYPSARIIQDVEVDIDWANEAKITERKVYAIENLFGVVWIEISEIVDTPELAWSDALKKINAAKRKKYYKRKITRPNNEKKGKVNIMLYPSDKTAIIGKYSSVQKFINTIVEQLKTK